MIIIPIKFIPSEEEARASETCPACGVTKSPGMLVCWDCFKYRADVTPLKYAGVDFDAWLRCALSVRAATCEYCGGGHKSSLCKDTAAVIEYADRCGVEGGETSSPAMGYFAR